MAAPRFPGSYKVASRSRSIELKLDPLLQSERRVGRILASIHQDVVQGGRAYVRQILAGPRELFRIELELPDMGYQRTTILDKDALEQLLEETDERVVREQFTFRYTR